MKMITLFGFGVGLVMTYACGISAQSVPDRLVTGYEPLDERLSRMVTADSSALSAMEARKLSDAVYLDARESEEYEVSHLPGAIHLGYRRPDYSRLDGLSNDTPLVVYCTIGYRSESMAEELKSRGFTQVYNLYGSIYAWILAGNPVVDENGPVQRVHTYNGKWGNFLPDSLVTKVY